ncbi:MAG: hypothetical protein B7X53_01250 [Hyphomonas sp. 34-62-18]|nr:sigma-70 family RNA polymerase sigma factor [Hyphomonas sp. 34-62-18]OZB19126.1 MAG: hypothetical protein B7X53_01250 [Hyphomonas sp. 34-62-18]
MAATFGDKGVDGGFGAEAKIREPDCLGQSDEDPTSEASHIGCGAARPLRNGSLESQGKPAFLCGDDALVQIYQTQYDQLVRFARLRIRSEADAPDLVHDAFLHVRRAYPGKGAEELRRLIFVSLRNKTIDYLKSAHARAHRNTSELSAHRETLACEHSASPEKRVMDRQLIRIVEEIISGMSRRRREILCLHRFDGLSYDEIAERLSISASTVKYNLGEATAELTRQLRQRTRI